MPVPSPAHREVQAIAKAVAAQIADTITPASTERTISETAQRMLAERGLSDTWYYQCPALVLLGSRSCLSVSGWAYAPGEEPVGEFNLVTIDLSPRRGPWWGDCARSFFVEQGIARLVPSAAEFREGHRCITELHAQMQQFVSVSTTFQQLYHSPTSGSKQPAMKASTSQAAWVTALTRGRRIASISSGTTARC